MRLEHAFYRLPLRFDATRLAEEVAALEESYWTTHPTGFPGNSAVVLISVNGEPNDDFAMAGAMRPAPPLERCRYLCQVLASLDAPLSRTRIMRIAGGERVPPHLDSNFHWHRRLRVHIPFVTNSAVIFRCGDEERHMAEGEAWIFDSSRRHAVENPSPESRLHLVADTRGSPTFWNLVARAETAGSAGLSEPDPLPFREDDNIRPEIESYRFEVLDPGEIEPLLDDLKSRFDKEPEVQGALVNFEIQWAEEFSRHGHKAAGEAGYRKAIRTLVTAFRPHQNRLDANAAYSLGVIGSMFSRTNRRAGGASESDPTTPADDVFVTTKHVSVEVNIDGSLPVVRLYGRPIRLPAALAKTLRAFRTPATRTVAFSHMRPLAPDADQFERDLAKLIAMRFIRRHQVQRRGAREHLTEHPTEG
jgi:hypothetical protein